MYSLELIATKKNPRTKKKIHKASLFRNYGQGEESDEEDEEAEGSEDDEMDVAEEQVGLMLKLVFY